MLTVQSKKNQNILHRISRVGKEPDGESQTCAHVLYLPIMTIRIPRALLFNEADVTGLSNTCIFEFPPRASAVPGTKDAKVRKAGETSAPVKGEPQV